MPPCHLTCSQNLGANEVVMQEIRRDLIEAQPGRENSYLLPWYDVTKVSSVEASTMLKGRPTTACGARKGAAGAGDAASMSTAPATLEGG